MLTKDRRYVPMESVKEKREIGYTRLSVKKKENENTDRAKYFNLLRVLAQSIPSISHKPLVKSLQEFGWIPSTFPILGSRNKRPKELEICEHR